jgi:hypothetical protein
MKFSKSKIYDELTIIMVCRNWVSLHYPFVEAIWSSIPLGCRYLIGVFDTTDNTREYLEALGDYVPITIFDGDWKYQNMLGAIGVATSETWQEAKTTARFNLQANEILTDESPARILEYFDNNFPSPMVQSVHGGLHFKHFWGGFNFEGSRVGAAYNFVRRIGNKNDDYIHGSGDGCYPEPPETVPTGGVIHRYSYCFDNQIQAKIENHTRLFYPADNVARRVAGIKGLENKPNYDGTHPSYVQHLLGRANYDINYSLQVFKNNMRI